MTNFFYRNRYKLIIALIFVVLLIGLTSCRFDSGSWYKKPYTSYGQEWIDLWNSGRGAFNTIFGWPVNLLSWPIAFICSSIGKALGESYFCLLLL